MDLFRRQPGVPEHALLHHDGDHCGGKGQGTGHHQSPLSGDLTDTGSADAKARDLKIANEAFAEVRADIDREIETGVSPLQAAIAERGGKLLVEAPAGAVTTVHAAQQIPQRLWDLPMRGIIRVAILFVIVLGGMYSGVFTPTESAAIGALAAGVMLVAEMWREGAKAIWIAFQDALKETAGTTSMVFTIIVGSSVLSAFFVAAKVPQMLADGITSWGLNGHLTLAIMLATLLPLGMMLETISILVITVPLIYPVAMSFGFDGIWLAILFVKLIEIGMVTPPVGINCFVVAGTAGVKVDRVFAGVLPFVFLDLIMTAILFAFPILSTWLPSLIKF